MNISFSTGKTVQGKPMKPWQGVLLGLVLVIAGISLLFFAISSIKTYNEKNKTYVETTSKVVDYKYNDDGLQAIVVEYVVNGQSYQKVSNSYSNMPKSIGTKVSIKYNPNNPKDAIWKSDSTNIILPIFGVVFVLVGVIVVISNIKNGKKQKMVEEQVIEQANELSSNTDVQPQINNANTQMERQINSINEQQVNDYNRQAMQQVNNVSESQMNSYNQQVNDAQPQINNTNPQMKQQINSINQQQVNDYDRQAMQQVNNVSEPQMNSYNQPVNNVQPQMNNVNQSNLSVDVNNRNNNINTNM